MMFFIHRTTAPGDIYLSDVRQGANDALQRVQGEREREVVVSRTQSPAKVVVVVVNVVVVVVAVGKWTMAGYLRLNKTFPVAISETTILFIAFLT